MTEEKAKVDVNVVQVVASALAAVSSAVLLSTVGVAGTVIGAAAGSVIATVGSAVYSYSLRASRERVAHAAALAAAARLRRNPDGSTRHLSTQEVSDTEPTGRAEKPSWRESLAALDKKKVALAAAGVFVAAMVVIVGFELVVGRPVSTLTGGTSGSDSTGTSIGVGHRRAASTPTKAPTTKAPTAAPTSAAPTPVAPTTGSVTSPSRTASASPTDVGTGAPTPTPTPSDTATPTATATPTG